MPASSPSASPVRPTRAPDAPGGELSVERTLSIQEYRDWLSNVKGAACVPSKSVQQVIVDPEFQKEGDFMTVDEYNSWMESR
eukprot:gene3519-3974_t